jgi:hypothetical protein
MFERRRSAQYVSPESQEQATGGDAPDDFDVFLSYSTKPDYSLARELERFLTSFHELPGVSKHHLRPLRVAFDQATFRSMSGRRILIEAEVRRNLARSARLLVLCSSGSAQEDSYVGREIDWFLEAHGEEGRTSIWIAVTEGRAPLAEAERYFPPQIRKLDLQSEQIWYDLRAYSRSQAKHWERVRDFDRERVRLACDLHERASGEIYPDWLEQQQRAARRRTRVAVVVAGVMTLLAAVAGVLGFEQHRQRQRVSLLLEVSEVRRQAAEARSTVPLRPEEGLKAAVESWSGYEALATRPQAAALQADLQNVGYESARALFETLKEYPHLKRSLTTVHGDGALAASSDGRILIVAGVRRESRSGAEVFWIGCLKPPCLGKAP